MSERASCAKCGASVIWVNTANGKRIALDNVPERRWVLDSGSDPMVAKNRNVYECHFDTCKGAR